jgi:hypothetical protein
VDIQFSTFLLIYFSVFLLRSSMVEKNYVSFKGYCFRYGLDGIVLAALKLYYIFFSCLSYM